MLQFILLNICVPFISTLLAFAFNTWSKIYFEKRQYNQKLLEDRYYKGYLPFFINFTTSSITNLFLLRQYLTSEDKVEIINKFNRDLCNKICYFDPEIQSELSAAINLGLLDETLKLNFFKNVNSVNLLINIYNKLLYKYKDICEQIKLPAPKIEEFLIDNIKNKNTHTDNTNMQSLSQEMDKM